MGIKDLLKNALKGRVTVVGVGNAMRGDDAFGLALAGRLRYNISAEVIDAGPAPENHVKAIRESKPDTVLIIDAADFGGKPGNLRLLKREDMPLYGISTHNASLALFFDFLEADTRAGVYMLAVQPYKNEMNAQLSDILQKRCEELTKVFKELLPK